MSFGSPLILFYAFAFIHIFTIYITLHVLSRFVISFAKNHQLFEIEQQNTKLFAGDSCPLINMVVESKNETGYTHTSMNSNHVNIVTIGANH